MKTILSLALVLAVSGSVVAQHTDGPPPPEEPAVDAETQKKIDGLIEKLASEDWDERAEAEKGLEEIGRPAVASLRKAMETATDPEVKVRAKRVLQKLGGIEVSADLTEEQFNDLLDVLRAQDGVSWYRRQAKPYFYMYQLSERKEFSAALKDAKFAPRLAKALDDASGPLKRNACYLLGDIGNADVAPEVAALLKDEEALTRAVALHTLMRLGNAKVAMDVIKALSDADPLARQTAAMALEALPVAEAIEPLLALLKDEGSDATIRFHAAYSLRSLTGQNFRYNAYGSQAQQAAAVKRFEEWWGKNKAGFVPKPPRKVEKESIEPEEERVIRIK